MPELSRISRTEIQLPDQPDSALPCSAALTLASASTPPLSVVSLHALGELMALVQARYPNQELPPGTETMFLAEWEEMVHRFGYRDGNRDEALGLELLTDALHRTLRDRGRAQFFPMPDEIETRIREKLRAKRERKKTLAELSAIEKLKAQWERDRAEDRAAAET